MKKKGILFMCRPAFFRKKNRGFTLLELIVVLVILSILAMIAAPGYRTMLMNSKMREFSELWMTSYYAAQREALLRKAPVVLCATTDGMNCDSSDKGKSDFSNGWILKTEEQKNGVLKPLVLQVVIPSNKNIKAIFRSGVVWLNSPLSTDNGQDVALYFQRDGRLPPSFVGKSMSISYIENNKKITSWAMCINTAGRIQTKKGTDVCR